MSSKIKSKPTDSIDTKPLLELDRLYPLQSTPVSTFEFISDLDFILLQSTMTELLLSVFSPDIFPIISSHLPLYIQPSTLLSVALTSRQCKALVIPRLLYQQVTLIGEKYTLKVLDVLKLQAESTDQNQNSELPLGYHLRCLDISSELSKGGRVKNVDVITRLHEVIRLGYLPNLVSLTLHLRTGWYYDADTYEAFEGFGRVDSPFWSSVKEGCPRLKAITLSGVNDSPDDRWLEDSGLFEYQGLESFRLKYQRNNVIVPDESPPTIGMYRLYDSLIQFSPNLHTLALDLYNGNYISVTCENGLFTRSFPQLKTLILREFKVEHLEVALDFWTSHPNLERIELFKVEGRCFSTPSVGLLPKLRVLKAPFNDILDLVPILGDQLVNLTVTFSINAQVPYLLRSVLPNGLPSLRSLGIYQRGTRDTRDNREIAFRWQEDENGDFSETSKRKAARAFDAAYMLSLARGVPNLEELEFIGESQPPIEPIASALSTFSSLKRLYFCGANNDMERQFIQLQVQRSFLDDAYEIALRCPTLEDITEVAGASRTHTCAHIERNPNGEVTVHERLGRGRVIGLEDEAYPGAIA